jgi:hypothetical protein
MAVAEKKMKRYQWIKSERIGDVVEVSTEQPDNKWLYFSDGTRINPSLVKEFLTEVAHDNQIMQFPDLEAPAQPIAKPVISQTVAPTTPTAPQPSAMGNMIMKMSKKNVVGVPVDMNVNIPSPALYAMLLENMEEADLKEEIMGVALAQIEIDKLQEYVKEQITNFLNTYYE